MLLYYFVGTGVCPKGPRGPCHHPPPYNLKKQKIKLWAYDSHFSIKSILPIIFRGKKISAIPTEIQS